MTSVILTDESKSSYYVLDSDSLQSLFQTAEAVFGKRIVKFVRTDDSMGIQNEVVFQRMVAHCKRNNLSLSLIAVEDDKKVISLSKNKSTFKTKACQNEISELEERKRKLESEYNQLLLETEVNLETREMRELEERVKKLEMKKAGVSNLYVRLEDSKKVDVCFLVDITGSMSQYFNQLIMTIGKINENLLKRFQNFELRCSLIGYRDHDDKENDRIIKLPFTHDIRTFESFAKGIKCIGGSDQCEDVFGGLEEVGKLNWTHPQRMLVHIADAPCHGKRFHFNALDDYSNGDPRGLKIENLLKKIVELDVSYYFIEINESTNKMISEFNKELMLMHANQIQTLKLTSVHEIGTFVEQTIVTALTKSKNRPKKSGIREYELVKLPAVWKKSDFNEFKCTFIVAKFNGNARSIGKSRIDFEFIETEVWMSSKPFAKGELRHAFASMLNVGNTGEEDVLLNSVVKESISTDGKHNSIEYHKEIVEIHVIASFLAKEFSKNCKQKIRVLNINLLHISELERCFTIEDFVEGEFYKWSNNTGDVDESIYASTLDAFSHWTYNVSNGYLMVVDLQGFKFKDKEFILTDPVIICPSEPDRFTNTNLGDEGIEEFFKKHKCNRICRKFGLVRDAFQSLEDRNY